MKTYIAIFVCSALILAALPFLLIAKARTVRSGTPRIHLIQDMDNQPRFEAQSYNGIFADKRGMRPAVPGTVARGAEKADDHFYKGKTGGEWAADFPSNVTIDMNRMERGQKQFRIYCAPCHGLSGYGNGIVAVRAEELDEGTWTPPTPLHSDTVRERPAGHIFNTITHGIRNMPSYAAQIPEEDRWAIVAYVLALQLSQNATLDDVPNEVRASLK